MSWFEQHRGVPLLNSGALVEMAEGWVWLWQWPEGLALTLPTVEDLSCRTRGEVTAMVSSAVKAHPSQGDGLHLVWRHSVGREFFPDTPSVWLQDALIPAGSLRLYDKIALILAGEALQMWPVGEGTPTLL